MRLGYLSVAGSLRSFHFCVAGVSKDILVIHFTHTKNSVMKLLNLICLSGLLFLGAGCKKKAGDSAIYYTADPEALSYLKLPLGNYYIYKDSSTGILDSVTVKKSDIQKIFYPAHTEIRSNWPFAGTYKASVPDSYYDSLTVALTKVSANGPEDWLLISHVQEKYNNDYYATDQISGVSHALVFWYPVYISNDPSTENNGVYNIPLVIIEGNTYQNVLRFIASNSNNPSQPYYLKTDYYWAKGIGVIKRNITTSKGKQTSTLVRKG